MDTVIKEPTAGPTYAESSAGTMNTYCKLKVNLLEPDPQTIEIRDIAHHLSMIPRFTGATELPYSVAEHSVHVAVALRRKGYSPEIQMAGLLHDAQEAYLNDLSKPIKEAMRALMRKVFVTERTPYDILEERMTQAIATRFNLKWDRLTRDLVKTADNEAYVEEAEEFMSGKKTNAKPYPQGLARAVFLSHFETIQARREARNAA